jgi:hypothetical protein
MPIADDALDAAVQDAWRKAGDPPEGMVTRWVLLAEGLNSNGTRDITYWWSEGVMSWDLKGLLHYALDDQVAGLAAELVIGSED